MTNQNEINGLSFLERYCKTYQCPAESFEKNVLWRCMPALPRPLAQFIGRVNRNFFRSDMALISELKEATRFSQVRDIISFYTFQSPRQSFVRQLLRLRMSRSKLLKLARSVLRPGEAEQPH
jgi:hypothetical protein